MNSLRASMPWNTSTPVASSRSHTLQSTNLRTAILRISSRVPHVHCVDYSALLTRTGTTPHRPISWAIGERSFCHISSCGNPSGVFIRAHMSAWLLRKHSIMSHSYQRNSSYDEAVRREVFCSAGTKVLYAYPAHGCEETLGLERELRIPIHEDSWVVL